MKAAFETGIIIIDRDALDVLKHEDIFPALCRHANCDWGDGSPRGKLRNNATLKHDIKRPIVSIYHDSNGTKFFIHTEWDRIETFVILAEDYLCGSTSIVDQIKLKLLQGKKMK